MINDHYNRKELIGMVSDIFGWKLTKHELRKRAKLWELAEHTTDAKILSKLSVSPYVEVRESVAWNCNTPVDILLFLLGDECCEVRETAVLNPRTPLSAVESLRDDEHELERNAVISRKKECE